ncbi:MAG: UDP-3-O-(3-hydroxymyristoyl)glucosamine N-acyltransferase [Candidatus Hydrogenedentota bacterium]|nr:MAG: UDP-3-O-(3-hydroxymyristoyl)glucosamine N-acyltransferase [Candidatus Hydrogenedentota bacterium]
MALILTIVKKQTSCQTGLHYDCYFVICSMTLKEIADKLQVGFQGDPNLPVYGIKDLNLHPKSNPLKPNFIYFMEKKRQFKDYTIGDAIVLTSDKLADQASNALLTAEENLRIAFIRLLSLYEFHLDTSLYKENTLIHPTATIASTARVLPGAVVMDHAVVENNVILYPGVVIEPYAKIGARSVLYPGAVVGHHCVVGEDCILHANSVIGADGFGFYDKNGVRYKIPQIGNVVLGNRVEIGATSTIDRATIESTTIGDDTKIDDQVHFGHNCQVGRRVYAAGNAGISGSVVVEDDVIIGGQVGVADHVRLGTKTMYMGLTGVPSDTEPNSGVYFGIPARPVRKMHRINAILDQLPDLIGPIKELLEKQKKQD